MSSPSTTTAHIARMAFMRPKGISFHAKCRRLESLPFRETVDMYLAVGCGPFLITRLPTSVTPYSFLHADLTF